MQIAVIGVHCCAPLSFSKPWVVVVVGRTVALIVEGFEVAAEVVADTVQIMKIPTEIAEADAEAVVEIVQIVAAVQ